MVATLTPTSGCQEVRDPVRSLRPPHTFPYAHVFRETFGRPSAQKGEMFWCVCSPEISPKNDIYAHEQTLTFSHADVTELDASRSCLKTKRNETKQRRGSGAGAAEGSRPQVPGVGRNRPRRQRVLRGRVRGAIVGFGTVCGGRGLVEGRGGEEGGAAVPAQPGQLRGQPGEARGRRSRAGEEECWEVPLGRCCCCCRGGGGCCCGWSTFSLLLCRLFGWKRMWENVRVCSALVHAPKCANAATTGAFFWCI